MKTEKSYSAISGYLGVFFELLLIGFVIITDFHVTLIP